MPREIAAPSSSGDFTRSACEAEAFGQLDEVGVAQVAGDRAVVERLLLDALDVAVGAVVEDDRDDADAVLRRGRQFLAVNRKPPSPLIDTTGLSGWPTLAPSAVAKPQPSVPW